MRTLHTKKAQFFIGTVVLLLLLYNAVITITKNHRIFSDNYTIISDRTLESGESRNVSREDKVDMKYILQWTSPKNIPFVYMGVGQSGFIERKCPYTNCIVTANRSYLGADYSKFDVIAFAGPELINLYNLPQIRSPHQKYVFASIESSDNYPLCSNRFDRYFNWTWTYKLDSEVRWGYFTIRDKNNTIIGPSKQMHWIKLEDMDPVSDDFKNELKTKTKAAAWFASNCYTRSQRENLVEEIQKQLQKYNLDVDTYGDCGNLMCPHNKEIECNQLIKKTYYFYLVFENAVSEDYVTEKLLHALDNNAVPIVYGGANYTRFMPNDIYLNARDYSVKDLARKMNEIINDSDKYSEYFKWKNHFTYHRKFESVETDPYCLFCSTLNDKEMVKRTTIYNDFRNWWDPSRRCLDS